ncbi:MAG: hypothetical protein IAF02_09605, partial [Anaerolineae bacterium]|nr:hypothetical protein [Anaerolineae bacterium]
MIRPLRVSSRSAFLEQQCALCKEAFVAGDEIIICPEDGARHHTDCWQANGFKCSAFGCTGTGQISTGNEAKTTSTNGPHVAESQSPERENASKVRVMPSSSLGCGQSCLLLSIAIAILVMAFGCFGLWAIADYLMIEVFHFDYRVPFSGMIL